MTRPRKKRRVCCIPEDRLFGPIGQICAEYIDMTIEEYETIRLIDFEKFTQEECAQNMHIARTTVQRIYASARYKLADSIVNGKTINISGGDYRLFTDEEIAKGFDSCLSKCDSCLANKSVHSTFD